MKNVLVTILLLAFLPASVWAADYEAGARAAHRNTYEVTLKLRQLKIKEEAHYAIAGLIRTSYDLMKATGRDTEAEQFLAKWKTVEPFFTSHLEDLGDHRPLNDVLAQMYQQLKMMYGEGVMRAYHLDDINTMNFAIPVVFQPRGDTQTGDQWDKAEYGRHFVPFSGVVAFWGAYGACKYASRDGGPYSRYCGQIAVVSKNGMIKYVAPSLSDFVFSRYKGIPVQAPAFNQQALESYYAVEYQKLGLTP